MQPMKRIPMYIVRVCVCVSLSIYIYTYNHNYHYNSPKTTSSFDYSGMCLGGFEQVSGVFLEDLGGGVWDMLGRLLEC